jgi:hypothetical protein
MTPKQQCGIILMHTRVEPRAYCDVCAWEDWLSKMVRHGSLLVCDRCQ